MEVSAEEKNTLVSACSHCSYWAIWATRWCDKREICGTKPNDITQRMDN